MDLEKTTKKAWRRFRNELADRIAGLAPHQSIGVGIESSVDDQSAGSAYVQFVRGEGDGVCAEASGNHSLHPALRLSKLARRGLAELGWSRPRPKLGRFNFEFEADTSHADQLAELTVVTLREVFAVPHPAFLTGDVAIPDDRELPQVKRRALPPRPPLAVMPDGRDDLERRVDAALEEVLGHTPNRDDDGDIPIVSGTAVVFVRVLPDQPVIRIWSEVVVEIADAERANFEVGVLNRDRQFTKFHLAGDRIIAQVHVPAAPFAPAHLRDTLGMMCGLADEIDDDLAVRVSGRRFLEPSDLVGEAETETDEEQDDADDLHPAMLTLLQLDADRPGSIKPSLAARVCDYDSKLLLKLIRWNEEQELVWRSSADDVRAEGESGDEAAVCDHEADHAKRTAKLLRKALRLVLEADLGDRDAMSARRSHDR